MIQRVVRETPCPGRNFRPTRWSLQRSLHCPLLDLWEVAQRALPCRTDQLVVGIGKQCRFQSRRYADFPHDAAQMSFYSTLRNAEAPGNRSIPGSSSYQHENLALTASQQRCSRRITGHGTNTRPCTDVRIYTRFQGILRGQSRYTSPMERHEQRPAHLNTSVRIRKGECRTAGGISNTCRAPGAYQPANKGRMSKILAKFHSS